MFRKSMMVPDDEEKGYAKTSLKMTRSMANDIGLTVKKILEDINNETVDLTYTEWQWFISHCWSDEIWIMALNKAITTAKTYDINLNKNGAFLELITDMTGPEFKKEMKKKHPIAAMSLMDLVNKKPPEPVKPRTFEDLWRSPGD